MISLNSNWVWTVAPSLGIVGCLQEHQQMRAGSVYFLSMDTQVQALYVARQILAGLDLNNRAVLLGCEKISVVVSALTDQQGPADLRSYAWRGTESTAVMHLTEQLDRKLNPRKRLMICLLTAETLKSLGKAMPTLLRNWRDWCESNGCILVLCAYGKHNQSTYKTLALEHRFLSGVAHLKAQTDGFIYQLDYWINDLGVQSAAEFVLQDKNSCLEVVKTVKHSVEAASDEVYLQRSVLEDAPVYIAEKWRIVEDWYALAQEALTVVGGTFVFALQASSEIEALARILYDLRQQRGTSVKLVVRETQQALRRQEVQLLLDCGAATVISADINLARFFSMLGSIPSQKNSSPLIDDLELALTKMRVPEIKGVVSVSEFSAYLNELLASTTAVHKKGVLLSLRPAGMLSTEQLLGQLRIVRKGDAACAVEGVVYLFLLGCQLDFVEITLHKIFALPFTDIVADYVVHSDRSSIEDHVRRLQLLQIDHIPRQSSLAPSSAEPSPVSDHAPLRANGATVLFTPRLKPVQLQALSDIKL